MKTLDHDRDGTVTFAEFKQMERRAQSLLFPVLCGARATSPSSPSPSLHRAASSPALPLTACPPQQSAARAVQRHLRVRSPPDRATGWAYPLTRGRGSSCPRRQKFWKRAAKIRKESAAGQDLIALHAELVQRQRGG